MACWVIRLALVELLMWVKLVYGLFAFDCWQNLGFGLLGRGWGYRGNLGCFRSFGGILLWLVYVRLLGWLWVKIQFIHVLSVDNQHKCVFSYGKRQNKFGFDCIG